MSDDVILVHIGPIDPIDPIDPIQWVLLAASRACHIAGPAEWNPDVASDCRLRIARQRRTLSTQYGRTRPTGWGWGCVQLLTGHRLTVSPHTLRSTLGPYQRQKQPSSTTRRPVSRRSLSACSVQKQRGSRWGNNSCPTEHLKPCLQGPFLAMLQHAKGHSLSAKQVSERKTNLRIFCRCHRWHI